MVVCGRITWRDIFCVILKVIQRNIHPEKDRHRSQMQRSKKVFKSEEEFLKDYQPATGGHMTRRFTSVICNLLKGVHVTCSICTTCTVCTAMVIQAYLAWAAFTQEATLLGTQSKVVQVERK